MKTNGLKKLCCLWAALWCTTGAWSQYFVREQTRQYRFGPPVNIPILLSANYGELRGAHFHSGIDIKTQGVIGKPVLAMADGYVARVAVSPSGFGKALYLNHPDGTTTVYGHLERFAEEIEDYIHELQYARQSFAVDVTPPSDKFVFRQGDRIALSGNRGSSGGPHLHLDVRETASQRPLNILARHMLSVADTVPPKAKVLYFVGIDTVQGIPVHSVRRKLSVRQSGPGRWKLAGGDTVVVSQTGYFAVEAEEKKSGTTNPMGIYTIDALMDGKQFFAMTVDAVPFDLTRYSYAAALYPESKGTRNGVYRLCSLPNNPLSVYNGTVRRGVLSLRDDEVHDIEIALGDDCGNRSVLSFRIRRGLGPKSPEPQGLPVRWNEDFSIRQDGLSLSFPKRTLYESILLSLKTKPAQRYSHSPLYEIHTADVPVQKSLTISIDAPDLPQHLRGKALLGIVGRDGHRSSAGGAWKDGRVTGTPRSFGTYYIAVDTVPPRIVPSFESGADFAAKKALTFKISDDFSGIASYSATIDGRWALFEYDPKTNTLTHVFDDTRWQRGGTHTLVLTVTDGKGNKSVCRTSYKR